MENQYVKTGNGLFYLFISAILSLLILIPFLGVAVGFASALLRLYAIYTLSQINRDYKTAFYVSILSLVLSIIRMLPINGLLMGEFGTIANNLLFFLTTFYICKATAGILWNIDSNLAKRAGLIWKLFAFCLVISTLCSLLSYIPLIGFLASMLLILIQLANGIVTIVYLVFLWKSQKTLRR